MAVLGALPSLIWAATRPWPIHDDWALAGAIHHQSAFAAFTSLVHHPGRPVAAAYYVATYRLFGAHPVWHALELAVLNGVVTALFVVVVRRLGGTRLAIAAGGAWVLLGNRGTTRFWAAMAPAVLALCLLLAGVLLLTRVKPRTWVATALFAAAVLAYEAVAALCVAAVVVAWWHQPVANRSFRRLAASVAPVFGAAGVVLLNSGSRSGSAHLFANASRWFPAQFGVGVFGNARLSVLLGLALLISSVVAVAHVVARGRAADMVARQVVAGLAVMALGLAPLVAVGFPVGTAGLFDRGNLFADLGTAIVFGAIACAVVARLNRPLAVAALVSVAGVLASPLLTSLHDYELAAHRGRAVGAELAALGPGAVARPLVVGPPLPARGGVAALLTTWDTTGYLSVVFDDPKVQARFATTPADFATATEPLRFDWRTDQLSGRSTPTS